MCIRDRYTTENITNIQNINSNPIGAYSALTAALWLTTHHQHSYGGTPICTSTYKTAASVKSIPSQKAHSYYWRSKNHQGIVLFSFRSSSSAFHAELTAILKVLEHIQENFKNGSSLAILHSLSALQSVSTPRTSNYSLIISIILALDTTSQISFQISLDPQSRRNHPRWKNWQPCQKCNQLDSLLRLYHTPKFYS